jgi:hypothetical protein
MQYETVEASSAVEAINKSKRPLGSLCPVAHIEATANSDKTYTLLHKYAEPVEAPKMKEVPIQPMVVFMERIRRMNETFQTGSNDTPTFLTHRRIWEFNHILKEEINELLEIEETTPERVAMTELADVLGDIVVYCFSEARRWGIPLDKVLHLIMDSQDSKLVNGKPLYNESKTKFIKGPHYMAPEAAIQNMLFQNEERQKRAADDGVRAVSEAV